MIFFNQVSNKGGLMVSVLHELLTISCMDNLRHKKAFIKRLKGNLKMLSGSPFDHKKYCMVWIRA